MTDTQMSSGSRRSLHFDTEPVIPFVTSVLTWLDYFYLAHLMALRPELFFGPEAGNDLAVRDLDSFVEAPARILSVAQKHNEPVEGLGDVRDTVSFFSSWANLPVSAWLQVDTLRRSTSFDVSLDGIGTAVEKIVDSLDPLSRELGKKNYEVYKRSTTIKHWRPSEST